jgi:AcrR family transcriptional regulator
MVKAAVRGRPREFDIGDALAAALSVFWRQGYEGASLSELTNAMGITRPSLYAAFGNKEALFRQALDLYEREKLAYVERALEAPTARAVAERFLYGAIETVTSSECRGCLGVIASVSCQSGNSPIRDAVLERTAAARVAVVERMQRAIDEGDFDRDVDAETITLYLMTVTQGLAVQASGGASAEQLQRVAATTMATWPGR